MLAVLAVLLYAFFGLFLTPQISESTNSGSGTSWITNATFDPAYSGETAEIARSSDVTLHLPHKQRWSAPRLTGDSVRLERIDYVADPGFDAWTIVPVHNGRTSIAATSAAGKPFRLTLNVVPCTAPIGC